MLRSCGVVNLSRACVRVTVDVLLFQQQLGNLIYVTTNIKFQNATFLIYSQDIRKWGINEIHDEGPRAHLRQVWMYACPLPLTEHTQTRTHTQADFCVFIFCILNDLILPNIPQHPPPLDGWRRMHRDYTSGWYVPDKHWLLYTRVLHHPAYFLFLLCTRMEERKKRMKNKIYIIHAPSPPT